MERQTLKLVRIRRGWVGKDMRIAGIVIPVCFMWLSLGFGGGNACAQETAPLPIESVVDSWTFDYTSPPRFSPDGRTLAYALNPSTRGDGRGVALTSDRFNQTGVSPTFVGQQIRVVDVE